MMKNLKQLILVTALAIMGLSNGIHAQTQFYASPSMVPISASTHLGTTTVYWNFAGVPTTQLWVSIAGGTKVYMGCNGPSGSAGAT
jgi:hypothetical protein